MASLGHNELTPHGAVSAELWCTFRVVWMKLALSHRYSTAWARKRASIALWQPGSLRRQDLSRYGPWPSLKKKSTICVISMLGNHRYWKLIFIFFYIKLNNISVKHDDVIKWKHLRPHCWLFGESTGHRLISLSKACDREFLCFFMYTWTNG